MHRRIYIHVMVALIAIVCVRASAATLSPEEKKKQEEFQKAYRNPDRDQRKAAIAILDGSVHPSSWHMIAGVVNLDPDKDLRLEAYSHLSKMPARDPSLGKTLADIFSTIKSNELSHTLEVSYAKEMTNSEFKTDVLAALVNLAANLKHPDTVVYYGGQKSLELAREKVNAERAALKGIIDAINKLAEAEINPTYRTPGEIRKWWSNNQQHFMEQDKKLLDKYKAEDEAAKKAASGK